MNKEILQKTKDCNGEIIERGALIECYIPYKKAWSGKVVRADGIRSTDDGTEIKCSSAPYERYPHLKICDSKQTRLIRPPTKL